MPISSALHLTLHSFQLIPLDEPVPTKAQTIEAEVDTLIEVSEEYIWYIRYLLYPKLLISRNRNYGCSLRLPSLMTMMLPSSRILMAQMMKRWGVLWLVYYFNMLCFMFQPSSRFVSKPPELSLDSEVKDVCGHLLDPFCICFFVLCVLDVPFLPSSWQAWKQRSLCDVEVGGGGMVNCHL